MSRWVDYGYGRSQRRGLAVLLGLGCAVVAVRLWRNPVHMEDPPARGAGAASLQDRIDPNVASLRELSALPGLGERRARELIAARQRLADPGGRPVFASAEDLLKVRGIGYALMRQVEPFLHFPGPAPTATAPAPSGSP